MFSFVKLIQKLLSGFEFDTEADYNQTYRHK